MTRVQQDSHLELRSGARGVRPYILGHRVRVQDIVPWNEEGLSADEIVGRVPTISLADVHAALAYYYDHRAEVDRQSSEDEAFTREVERVQDAGPGSR